VQDDLGLSTAAAGAIASGASAVYCVGAVAGFLLAGRAARTLVAVAALVAAGGAAGMATAAGPLWFGVASVVGSSAAGVASPALVRIVTERFAEQDAPRAQAVVNAGTGPGLVVAGVLALVLLPDWRAAWAWSSVAGLVVGAVLLTATGAPSSHTTAGARPRLPGRDWVTAHRGVATRALLFGAGSAVIWTYGRSTLAAAGTPAALSVVAWIALGAGGAAVVLTARWTARLVARTAWTVTALPVAVAVAVLGAVPQWPTVAIAACAVFGWGYTAATGALIARTTELDAEHAAAGTSVLFVALVLGQAVGSAAAGALVDASGHPITFLAGAVVTAASAVPAVTGAWRGRRPGTSVTSSTPRHDSGVMATKR
jgi:predicted MFS family arabinose efflux permease